MGPLSLVIGHWSFVIGRWSLVIGRWSLVVGPWSFFDPGKAIALLLSTWAIASIHFSSGIRLSKVSKGTPKNKISKTFVRSDGSTE